MHVNIGYQEQALPLVELFAERSLRTTPSLRRRTRASTPYDISTG
jgi:hypothetical protein